MMNYVYKFSVLILLVAVGIGVLRFYKVDQYASAIQDGEKQTCTDFQKGITKYKGDCWSCPDGYRNRLNEAVSNPADAKHCRKKNSYANAVFHSKPTGMLNLSCKTKEVWFKNKACWTCPSGYKPARVKEDDGKAQCKPEVKYTYSAATKIGQAGCPDGAWVGTFSKKCFRCPEGYNRNILKTALDNNPSNAPKACKAQVSIMDTIFST